MGKREEGEKPLPWPRSFSGVNHGRGARGLGAGERSSGERRWPLCSDNGEENIGVSVFCFATLSLSCLSFLLFSTLALLAASSLSLLRPLSSLLFAFEVMQTIRLRVRA